MGFLRAYYVQGIMLGSMENTKINSGITVQFIFRWAKMKNSHTMIFNK